MMGKLSLFQPLLIVFWPLWFLAGEKWIAVLKFTNKTNFGDTEFPDKARDAFEDELVSMNRFTLVDRSRLNLIMKEQAFAQNGLVDQQTMSRLGKLAVANYICTGTIVALSREEKGSEKFRDKALSIFGITRSTDLFDLTRGGRSPSDRLGAQSNDFRPNHGRGEGNACPYPDGESRCP